MCVCVCCSCCLIYWHIQSCCYSLLYLHLQQFPRSPTIIIGSLCVNNCEFVYIAWRSLCFPLVFAPLALLPATYIRTHVQRLCVCVCAGSLICIPTNCSIVAIVVRDKNLWGSRSTCFVYAQQRPPRDECFAPHTTHTPPTPVPTLRRCLH